MALTPSIPHLWLYSIVIYCFGFTNKWQTIFLRSERKLKHHFRVIAKNKLFLGC